MHVVAFASDAQTFSSAGGDRSITVAPSGVVTYQSGNGVLVMRVTKEGLQIGDFELKGTAVHLSGDEVQMHISVGRKGHLIEDDLQGTLRDDVIHGNRIAKVNDELRAFAISPEGQLLQEAKELIASLPTSASSAAPAGKVTSRRFKTTQNFWGCAVLILNDIAGGAAMIGGCGTPACGTAYVWCCVSGASWFASGLIQTATSADCVY